jgi:hypothetical protein
MTIEKPPANIPINCRPGETVTESGEYYCFMCAKNGPVGHVSLSRGIHERSITKKKFIAGEKFDNSCPEHGTATGWTIDWAKVDGDLGNALFAAIERCDPDIVYALIDKGADVNSRRIDGSSALMLAASIGCDDVVQVLLNRGADVNARKVDGTTALMESAIRNHINVLYLLLDNGADANVKKIDSGATALEIAASGGHIDIVRALIDKGAHVNATNFRGHTALVCAGLNGHKEIVEFLKGVNTI